eukprot:TRINITY_DN1216_c0_g2_i2.p3 TRINITY_DN1216_c0_g2~~TRINITY_DN1216_c0_g2_i2.p3  ORF type:complete len:132 (-),score=24.30 TRINITY_DN1216_c0_g2_i2:1272-1667(-)
MDGMDEMGWEGGKRNGFFSWMGWDGFLWDNGDDANEKKLFFFLSFCFVLFVSFCFSGLAHRKKKKRICFIRPLSFLLFLFSFFFSFFLSAVFVGMNCRMAFFLFFFLWDGEKQKTKKVFSDLGLANKKSKG